MSTISLIHEGNISIEHLASMSSTALVVDTMVTAKRSQRIENRSKDDFENKPSYGVLFERWFMAQRSEVGTRRLHQAERSLLRSEQRYAAKRQKAKKSQRPSNHELSLVALWADHDGQHPFRVTVTQTAPQALDMLVSKEMATPKAAPTTPQDFGAVAGIPPMADAEQDDDFDHIHPQYREEAKRREAAYWAKRNAANARRKERAAQRETERREANRQHWAKVYQRPEAEQAAKRSLSDNAVLSTATK